MAEAGTLAGIQTPGGTGALRLAADLYAQARPGARIWVGTPTWPNHVPIFSASGLKVEYHPFFNPKLSGIDFDAMIDRLRLAHVGDLVLLHGCCHNPTGLQFSEVEWRAIADLCAERGIVPLIDLAYQGLGDGWEADAAGMRQLLARVPDAMIAYSCDKNFGLYRERVGALWVMNRDASTRGRVWQNMLVLARSLWSMPPDHGAAIVRIILEDAALTAEWRDELQAMRGRLNDVRRLVAAHPGLEAIGRQRGMFGLLPVAPDDVVALRRDHGIYMAGSGRINIAGLTPATIERFVTAITPYLPHTLELQNG